MQCVVAYSLLNIINQKGVEVIHSGCANRIRNKEKNTFLFSLSQQTAMKRKRPPFLEENPSAEPSNAHSVSLDLVDEDEIFDNFQIHVCLEFCIHVSNYCCQWKYSYLAFVGMALTPLLF